MFNRWGHPQRTLLLFAIAITCIVIPIQHADAALVTSLTNGDFETSSGVGNFQATVDDWDQYMEGSALAGIWHYDNFTQNSSYPAISGDNALGLIPTASGDGVSVQNDMVYIFQSIGTVTASDVDSGYVWGLNIRAGARGQSDPKDAVVSVSFRTGTLNDGTIGTLIGNDGELYIFSPDSIPTQLALTETASFKPTNALLGQEIFAVIAIDAGLMIGSQNQYYLDNAILYLPEPASAFLLLGLGVFHVGVRRRA